MQMIDNIKFYETKQGYLLGQVNKKPKRMHIYVWEKHNGKVPKGYYVHHIDGNKTNNSIENLQLITPKEHNQHHCKEPQRLEMSKRNMEIARVEASKWHGSEKGRSWHRELWKKTIGNKMERTVAKQCEVCGKTYFVNPMCVNKSKFCGNNCKARALRQRRKAERNGEN